LQEKEMDHLERKEGKSLEAKTNELHQWDELALEMDQWKPWVEHRKFDQWQFLKKSEKGIGRGRRRCEEVLEITMQDRGRGWTSSMPPLSL
jgi:hypothetical protein